MIHLWQEIEKIKKLLRETNHLLLLLDYDGTIVPIAPTPKEAVLPVATKNLLEKLCGISNINLGIISGRSLKEIKEMVGIPGIIYAGNHGLEWEIRGKQYRKFRASVLPPKLKKGLKILESKFPGVFIEDKELILAIHFRLLDRQNILPFTKYLKYIIRSYIDNLTVTLFSGKKVYEVRPNIDWDKGKLIEYLINSEIGMRKDRIAAIYIGDDKTDEDVFLRLDKAITIKVGKGKSKARYYLKNTCETIRFLKWIHKNYKRKV